MQPQQLQKPVSPSKLTLEPSVQQDAGELVLAALWPSKPQASFTASPGSIQDSAQDVLMDSSPSAEPQPEPLAPQGQLLQQHQLQQEQDPWNAVEDAVPSSLLVSEIRDSLEITDCPTLDLNPLLAVELSLPQSPASPTARQLAHVDAVLARSESLLAAADAVMLDAKTRRVTRCSVRVGRNICMQCTALDCRSCVPARRALQACEQDWTPYGVERAAAFLL